MEGRMNHYALKNREITISKKYKVEWNLDGRYYRLVEHGAIIALVPSFRVAIHLAFTLNECIVDYDYVENFTNSICAKIDEKVNLKLRSMH
jgi:hypothetical protein